MAEQRYKETGKLPISIDNSCLSCMAGNRDTSIVLKLFKSACLSYAPSEINYREQTMSRQVLIGLRRAIIEKVTAYMTQCGVFSEGTSLPRRYYDDLILEQELQKQQSHRTKEARQSDPQLSIAEMLNSKTPFGVPSGRLTKGAYTGKHSMTNFMHGNVSSQFLPSEDTNTGSGAPSSFLKQLQLNRDSTFKMTNSAIKPREIYDMSSKNLITADLPEFASPTKPEKLSSRHIHSKTIDVPETAVTFKIVPNST